MIRDANPAPAALNRAMVMPAPKIMSFADVVVTIPAARGRPAARGSRFHIQRISRVQSAVLQRPDIDVFGCLVKLTVTVLLPALHAPA